MLPLYTATLEVPAIGDYLRLRRMSGLSLRSEKAAAVGLANTVAGVVVRHSSHVVGIGRAIGDGLFYQIVDIAVEAAHRRRGLGTQIVSTLLQEIERLAPAEAHVSLIADGEAHKLYAKLGFAPAAPASICMALWLRR